MIYRAVPSGAAKNELRGTRAEAKTKVRTPWLIKTVLSSLQLRALGDQDIHVRAATINKEVDKILVRFSILQGI